MDAFYASVEIKDNPHLKGLPVVVGGSPESRSVVCAASYAARKFGIRSAMACSKAKKLCPEAIFLRPRFDRYREISKQIHQVFKKYTDLIEPLSLDEAWLDVTTNHINNPSATWIARMIKNDIKNQLNLIGSAGVSFNKFLAKIASDEDKPDGLFVITPNQASDFLKELPVRKLPGVGKVTVKKLELYGIEKGKHLLEKEESFLIQHFGKFGKHLHKIIRGIDERPIITQYESKSVGIETTFNSDLEYGETMQQALDKLLDGLDSRLNKKEKKGKTLTLKVKFADFKQITRSETNPFTCYNQTNIPNVAHKKLYEICHNQYPNQKIRLVGVSISNFVEQKKLDEKAVQLDMDYFLNNTHLLSES
jgi:DNA polymerase IV